MGQARLVQTETDELLRLFSSMLDPRHPENAAFADLEYLPSKGVVSFTYRGRPVILHFSDDILVETLAGAARDGGGLWGPGLTPAESAARLMLIHLDESLATRAPHASNRWTYDGSFFNPVPPWEVHAARHR